VCLRCSLGGVPRPFLSATGVAMDRQKVQATLDWPVLCTVSAVRTFLGLAGYYLHLGVWLHHNTTDMVAAQGGVPLGRRHRGGLPRPPTGAHFDWDFVLECDAFGTGFDAVLHQGARPLAFFNKPIAVRHCKLAAYECELIGLVPGIFQWRAYLWGRRFVVRTDHYSLKYLFDQKLATILQHLWASKL
jgi:hypothetical protein